MTSAANIAYKQATEFWSQDLYAEAIQKFREAVRANPKDAHLWYALGGAHYAQKEYRKAKYYLRKSVAIDEEQSDIYAHLCDIYYQLADYEKATQYGRKAVQVNEKDIESSYRLADSLEKQKYYAEAASICDKILGFDDQHIPTKLLAVTILRNTGYAAEARILLKEIVEERPELAIAWNNLGLIETSLANESSALYAFEKAEALAQLEDKSWIGSNLLFQYASKFSEPYELLKKHQEWNEKYSKLTEDKNSNQTNKIFDYYTPNFSRKIKVGYISGDFRSHSVSYFIQGILENHDRNKFEIYAFVNNPDHLDPRADEFKDLADHWIDISLLSDLETTQKIRLLQIDILIDLSGHTGRNRLLVFGCRAAPIQATYIGYFATTGVSNIDYWITDLIVHPPDTVELATEKIVRLSRCYLAYSPPNHFPEVQGLPYKNNGFITFGSYIASRKLSDYSILLWSEILKKVHNSRLRLKNKQYVSPLFQQEIRDRFELCGVDPERIDFVGLQAKTIDHLNEYNKLDIALDTYPASGCTTTAEALWMGIPVLTRLGDLMVSRNSASLLHALNLQDWIAETDEEYIEKGVQFAQSIDQLALLRQGMRERFMQSELYDSQDLTRHLEDFYLKALQEKLSGNGEVIL